MNGKSLQFNQSKCECLKNNKNDNDDSDVSCNKRKQNTVFKIQFNSTQFNQTVIE